MSSLNNIDSYELVSSKENIQPLRRGRDTTILCAALQAETDTDAHQELEKQRNEFEIKLRSNTNEDPLSDWCAYIHWIEQSFPKQAREGKLNVILQKCINKFKDYERYMNDVRFVKICIKYADIEENTVELLSQIHGHGIGVSCAELYIAWAEKYAVDNCFKKANAIYERGFQNSAQPVELLQEAHQNFQSFLVRKMLNEKETFQPTLSGCGATEFRQPYNALQSLTSGRKEVVPSVRIGANVLGTAGKLHHLSNKDQKQKSNKIIKVFEDTENNYSGAEPKAKIEKLPCKKTMTKENTIKPSTWNNHSKHVPFAVSAPTQLPFEVHRDGDDKESCKKSRSVPLTVLKSHKPKSSYEDENFANAPLFYPEPYDPTKLSMYCKEQVYAGGLEFQFEELRAIQYRRKMEKSFKKTVTHKAVDSESSLVSVVKEEPVLVVKHSSPSYLKNNKKKLECEALIEKKKPGNFECRRKTDFSNPVHIVESLKSNCGPEEHLPSTEYSMNQTIHTKEALSEMQQLWFSKPASPVSDPFKPTKQACKSILKPSKPCFSFYVDESCLENLKQSERADKPLDLTLKSGIEDEEQNNEIKAEIVNKIKHAAENCKENVFPSEVCTQEKKVGVEVLGDDEDKENGIPENYCGPVGKPNRKVSGILTPAENIEIAPLSDEEVEINEDEDGENQDFSSIIQCNTTAITETWNFTKGFQFPRGESTPNVRKSLRYKEECNNSVVEQDDIFGIKKTEDSKFEEINSKIISSHRIDKRVAGEGDNVIKNLSVIAETSREYRSSSSGSSGASTLALRSSKNCFFTPSEGKNKLSLTPSQTTLHKTKAQSLTGYEASTEFSPLKTQSSYEEKVVLNTTFDLMAKLNAIESLSVLTDTQEDGDRTSCVNSQMMKLELKEEKKEKSIDPFNDDLINKFLRDVDFPRSNHSFGYFLLDDTNLAAPKVGSSLTLGAHTFEVKKLLGEGSYAKIYKLYNTRNGHPIIAKVQKPSFPWEFYITREVQTRIREKSFGLFFMNVESAYFFKNCSVLLTQPVEYGDLLSVINKMKQGKMMCQLLAVYFICQILNILETLHSCKIIHGDVKPDNFLLRNSNSKLQLQLIDFGRSIDMTLFPEGTSFQRIVTTEGFTTVEMRLGKPWTYQIDLYGLANCGHCLLFGDYMKIAEKNGIWNITRVIPRYWARAEWRSFFVSLLNVESCSKLPDLSELRKSFEEVLEESTEFEFSLFKLQNLLNDR